MKTSIIKSILALSILAILSGCADDPVVTSQTTTSRRVMSEPAPMESTTMSTMSQPTTVRQTHSTTTTAY
jgi:hypothetical protein